MKRIYKNISNNQRILVNVDGVSFETTVKCVDNIRSFHRYAVITALTTLSSILDQNKNCYGFSQNLTIYDDKMNSRNIPTQVVFL